MSIYNVAILCIITAPVTMVISDQENATFAFVALANVFCCYLSMALVFVPKVRNVVDIEMISELTKLSRLSSSSSTLDTTPGRERMKTRRRSWSRSPS